MSDAVIFVLIFASGETMKKKYEHPPGLFGLALIAAGCAAKNRERRSEEKSTVARRQESRSQPVQKTKQSFKRRSGSDAGL
jgi:hypothetical protein